MRDNPSSSASRGADRELHQRLLTGDPTAPFDLVQTHLEPLTSWLWTRFPRMDRRDLEEIAFDSVTRLAEQPAQYDPSRASLAAYLRMDAKGDALNALERAKRRTEQEISLQDVELLSPARNRLATDEIDPSDWLASEEDARVARAWVDEHFVGSDREILWLMYAGERRTEVYARVLGIDGLSDLEQRREVKRRKDRINARLKRLGVKAPNHG